MIGWRSAAGDATHNEDHSLDASANVNDSHEHYAAVEQTANDLKKPNRPMIPSRESGGRATGIDGHGFCCVQLPASAPSSLDFGVEFFEFCACVFDGELPIDATLFGVGFLGPGLDF